jgi:hypothetical protein
MADKQRKRWGPVAPLLIVAAMIGSVLLVSSDRALATETVAPPARSWART